MEVLGGEGDEQVLAVVAGDGEHAGGALDAGAHQELVVRCVAVQRGYRRVALVECLDRFHGFVDSDEFPLGRDQLVHDIGADPADAADDVMAIHAIDLFLRLRLLSTSSKLHSRMKAAILDVR